uniref:SKP1-like protein n=1 Tax=Bicosoecida sp. CB-2014 TaxID=1486930 RepID=A0A7S1CGS7_9STRA
MAEEQKWKVVSDDGQEFWISEGVIRMSEPLLTQWEAVADDDEPEPLRVSAKGETLAKVFEWAKKHVAEGGKDVAKLGLQHPLKEGSYTENGITEADAAWVEELRLEDTFLDVVNLANTLAMQELLSLLCMRVAFWFKGKTPREIQEYFGIEDPNVLSPEEITAQCDAHKWAEKLAVGGTDGEGDGDMEGGASGGAGGESKA